LNWYKKIIFADYPKRMPRIKLRKFLKFLRREGCWYVRESPNGGHQIWRCPNGKQLTIPNATEMSNVATKLIKDDLEMTIPEFVNRFRG